MDISRAFILTILRSVPSSINGTGKMCVIIKQPYDYLINELKDVFKGQDDVEIKMDIRQEDRRRGEKTFAPERRQADRRRSKDKLLEVIIAA